MIFNAKQEGSMMRSKVICTMVALAWPVNAVAMDASIDPAASPSQGSSFSRQAPERAFASEPAPQMAQNMANDKRYPPVDFDPQMAPPVGNTGAAYQGGGFDFPDVNFAVRGRMNFSAAADAASAALGTATNQFGNAFGQGYPYGQGYGAPYGTPFVDPGNSPWAVPSMPANTLQTNTQQTNTPQTDVQENAGRASAVQNNAPGAKQMPPAARPFAVPTPPTPPAPPQWVEDNRKRQAAAQRQFANQMRNGFYGPQGYGQPGYGASAPYFGPQFVPPMPPPYGPSYGFAPGGPQYGGFGR